jgi:AcrR family transcriptional regulator
VTKGSFYHHNETKADLVGDCFERSFDIIRRAQRAAMETSRSGWEELTAAADALVRYQLSEHGPLLRYTALAAMPENLRPQAVATLNRLSERFAGIIVDGIADGSIRAVDPSVAAQLVNGMTSSAADLTRWVKDATPDTAPDLFARPLFEGLLTPPRR